MGCRLAIQAFSFRLFSLYEAIEKTATLGLKYIEAYPGQILSGDRPDLKFDYDLPDDVLAEVKAKLSSSGVTLINFGVAWLPKDEARWRDFFAFAKKMGIETIAMEPAEETIEQIDALCQEFDVRVAIHNHPKPSHYWNPETVLRLCEGRSRHIGACPDTGHWIRSGIDPVEGLRMLEGRIISLHVKDLDELKPDANLVPWGLGKGNIAGQFAELERQGLNPVIAIEYEDKWEDSMKEISQCIDFCNRINDQEKK